GGFVEVSLNGGTFKPLSIASNGYNHVIQAASSSSNLHKGFGGDSTDWYTSKASLSSFAGKHVKLRFRMRTDGFAAFSASYGWWLDNVRVYSCRGPSAPTSVQASNLAGLKAKLSWGKATPNPGFTIAHYVVRRSGSSWRTLSASARSATWSSLVKGQTYTFYVYATNNRGAKGTVVSRNLKIT
ncbi:MAG: bacillolysin, partial [Actinomycetota bacterium]|nr:bacillolysin [Actinomycetota bacterium]